jgi:hypothetical protein
MTTRGFSPVPVDLGSFGPTDAVPASSTARDLARALSKSAIATPWSLDRANVLWTEGYEAHVGHDRPTPADSLPTLAIDIGDRISSVGSP